MIQIIGWTILHSLWQIALIASIYLLIKHSWQAATALKKYYLAVTSLVTTFLSTIFTFGYLFEQNNTLTPAITDSTLVPITSETSTTTLIPVLSNEIVVETSLTFADYLTVCLPYLVTFWGLGLLYFTIRFLKNLYGVKQLQNIDNELISGEWLTKINIFKTQLNIEKEVQVFLSLHVKEPITFGHFKPIILLPISLITGFDSAAIETILLHELAHIKRHDYLVNLGQSIIEIILFYHPLVWWLSKDIRELREHCCDDLVLSLGDNRITYVETLTALQWRKVGGMTNRLSLSASGGNAGFTRRIKRMFGVEEKRGSFRQLMGMFLVLLAFAVGGIWLKNELSLPMNKDSISTFIVDKNTTVSELDELTEKMRDLEIFKSFCWLKDDNILTSINGEFYDAEKNIQYFDITDIRQTPTQFIFENGLITEISDLYNQQSIYLKSAKQSSILINAKTTKAELATWAKMVNDQGIQFDFKQSVFDKKGKVTELRGSYDSGDKKEEFGALDLACVNVKFELYKDQISEAIFSYPCREMKDDFSDNLIIIDNKTKKSDLLQWSDKLANNNIKFDYAESMFDENGKLLEFKVNYKDGNQRSSFAASDMSCSRFYFHLMGEYLIGPEFLKKGETPHFERHKPNQVILNYQNNPNEFSFLVTNGRNQKDLFRDLSDFQKKTGTQITFDHIGFYEDNELMGSLTGKISLQGNKEIVHTFEIQDLEKYSLLFRGTADQIYPPQYIENSTQQIISVKQTTKPTKYTLLVSAKTTKADLAMWAKSVLDYGVVFYYEKYVFDTNDNLIGLNGKFIGEQGYFEEFYYSLKEVDLKLEVEDNFIYQPTIISKIEEKEDAEVANQLSSKTDNSLKRDYEIGLLQATNEKERIFWREKLAALEEMSEQLKAKPYLNFKPNFLNEPPNDEATKPGLSYKITNWKALGLDSLEYSLENERNQNYGNGIAKLIPPLVMVEDSVRAMNPIYRANMEKAKSIFVNGQKVAKKDLPTYMQNHLQEAIKTDNLKAKRYPKTDTAVDWLYWGDQKINLGAAYKKDENGDLKWDVAKLQISKEVWDNNKDRPFIFQIDGDWYRVKDLDMVVLVPSKQDPASVNFHKDYAKALSNKEGSVFKLLARAKERDNLYFEKIDIGLPINISMAIKIIENNSIGYLPKIDKQTEQPNKLKGKIQEVPTTEKVLVATERIKQLPTIGLNSPNRVHWGNLEFEVQATVKERINEEKAIQISTLEITQAQWERLHNQPFSLDFNNNWYSVKTVKEIVHVPFKKYPSAASLHKSYIQVIKDETHRATKLLTKAKVNDYLYFEQIGVGENFTFGMAVRIVENQPKHSIK